MKNWGIVYLKWKNYPLIKKCTYLKKHLIPGRYNFLKYKWQRSNILERWRNNWIITILGDFGVINIEI